MGKRTTEPILPDALIIINEITKEDLAPTEEEKSMIQELYDWERASKNTRAIFQ